MKTSMEIKNFIVDCISSKKFFNLYIEIFEELKCTTNPKEIKAINYRWASACNEARKELKYELIDDTFFRSIVCYNVVQNFRDMKADKETKQRYKIAMGWDAEAITNGKHCKLAQFIIYVLESHCKKEKDINK